eukprot:TRINITY_DN18447_c0_g1_i1.p1 TRINITY_DN18447_c0_g1~~TRINITY_DN18447_c0_g1_i1.p1  ORF type:complete len:196 (+),score=16.12 TRINITY_DN18447_c0_g1_i1:14-601(+)
MLRFVVSTPILRAYSPPFLLTNKTLPFRQNFSSSHDSHSGVARFLGTDYVPGKSYKLVNITLDELMRFKDRHIDHVHSVYQEDSIATAIKTMARARIGAILVTDEKGQYSGILTERDYLNSYGKSTDLESTPIKNIMTKQTCFIKSDETILSCLEMMDRFGFRHLPVRHTQTNLVIGMVSIRDLIKAVVKSIQAV